MAERKKKQGVITVPEAAVADGVDDLQVLHPEVQAIINGRRVTVREYGFVEGLQLRSLLQPFLDELYVLAKGDTAPSLDRIIGLVGTHSDALMPAVAQAAGIELEELKGLKNQAEGMTLVNSWWIANGPFLWRCVLDRVLVDLDLEKRRAGATSTQSSSEPVTETSSESAS